MHSEESPSKKWHLSVSKDIDGSKAVFLNIITVSTHSGAPQPRVIDLPDNARQRGASGYPEYEFAWSPKEEWLAIIVTYKYGQGVFTVGLSGPPEKSLKAKECKLQFDHFEQEPNGDIALTEVGGIEFVDEKRCFVSVGLTGSQTQKGIADYFVRQDLATGVCKKLK